MSAQQNQRGNGTPVSATQSAAGAVNVLGSQSYTYVVPFFSLPGRHGLDLNLSLYYNSAIWESLGGSGVEWNPDTGYGFYTPFPGFRLDLGNLIWYETSFATQGVLIDSTGGKHGLIDTTGTQTTFSTVDSTHITINHHASTGSNDPATDLVTYPNGLQVSYQFGITNALGDLVVMQPKTIHDTMGNTITINYTGGNQFTIPGISSIVDSSGRTISFFYTTAADGNTVLQCVTDGASCGTTGSRTFTFTWTGGYVLNYGFSNLINFDGWGLPPLQGSQFPYTVLSGVTRPDGTRLQFNYGDWLIVNDIQEFSNNGTLRYETSYNFPIASSGALSRPPTYTQRTVTTFDKDGNKIQATWAYGATISTSSFPFVLCSAITDPNGNITLTTFSNNGDAFDGLPIQTVIGTGSTSPCTTPATTVLRTRNTQWTSDASSGTPTGINARPQSVTTILDDGTTQSQVQPTYDSNGNATDVKEFDFGSGSPGPLLRETVASYATNTGNVVNLPSDVQVKDGGGNAKAHTAFTYDGNGNLTGSTAYPDATSTAGGIASSFTYDPYGNMLTAQAGCCTFKEWSYSSATNFTYPDSITIGPGGNAASLTTFYTWNMNTGTLATVKDPNRQVTSFTYDLDNRPTGSTLANGVTVTQAYDDSGANPSVTTSDSANSRVTKSTTDSLGRALSSQLLNGGAVVSTTASINDAGGRPMQVSNPYGPSDTALYTTYSYDALGRVTLTTPPTLAGVTQQNGYQASYSGATVTFTDPAGNQRKQYLDGVGRLARVDEPGGGSPATVSSGSLTINGTLQSSSSTAATSGHAELTFSGTLKSKSSCSSGKPCSDNGSISITVAGFTKSAAYSSSTGTDSGQVVQSLVNAFNQDTKSPVNAIDYGADEFGNYVMDLVAKSTGAGTNYPLSTSIVSKDPTDFPAPSFQVSAGSSLIGGQDASGTVYDSGVVYLSVGNFTSSAPYSHTGNSTAATIASALVGSGPTGLNQPGSPVTAAASGATITVTYKRPGAAGNVFVSVDSTTANPDNPSFTSPGTTLSGGADTVPPGLATPAVTLYSYDALNNLAQITQGQQTRTYVYDGLRRMTSSAIPETANQATTFTYTDFGAVATKLDPRGITTTFGYEALNRLSTVTYSNGTPTATYTYGAAGAANFAAGRLTSAGNSIASETYQYDSMGNPVQIAKTIGGNPYTVSYAYNPDGTLKQTTYPSGRVVTNAYDPIARLAGVSAGSTNYLAINSYNAAGQVLTTTFGNTMTGSYTYNNQMQLNSILAQSGTTPVLSLSYNYGGAQDNGQIQGITDNVSAAMSTAYSYDPLSRLVTAQTVDQISPGTWALSFAYDRYGNRLSETPIGGTASMPSSQLLIDPPTNHVTTAGFRYDANGNMTSDSANNYTFDGANRTSTATPIGGGSTTSYYYDAMGQRVKKNGNIYIFDGARVITEYANSAPATSPNAEYVYAGEQRVANVIAGVTTYNYWDHLSIRVNADSLGKVIRNTNTFPFGESMQDTGSASGYLTKWKFTTFERDSESSLDHAWFRQYAFLQGRWITPDQYTGSMSLADPQSMNRYAAVGNDPINFTDPLGLTDCPQGKECPPPQPPPFFGPGNPANGCANPWDASCGGASGDFAFGTRLLGAMSFDCGLIGWVSTAPEKGYWECLFYGPPSVGGGRPGSGGGLFKPPPNKPKGCPSPAAQAYFASQIMGYPPAAGATALAGLLALATGKVVIVGVGAQGGVGIWEGLGLSGGGRIGMAADPSGNVALVGTIQGGGGFTTKNFGATSGAWGGSVTVTRGKTIFGLTGTAPILFSASGGVGFGGGISVSGSGTITVTVGEGYGAFGTFGGVAGTWAIPLICQ
jgi:RHS repeat-associated protein